jgi:4-amino-4-deoxy-L-arabinose transferase-like glycosyltransferase
MATADTARTQNRLLLACVVLLFLTVISDLVTLGMAPDGTAYAGIALRLASGEGSFWYPPSFVAGTSFHDHPPLGLYLQSLMFGLLGDHFWVENLYSALMLLCTVGVLHRVCDELGIGDASWYVVLLFLIFPVVAFVYTNNFLEITMNTFALLALWGAVRATRVRFAPACLAASLSGVAVLLAVLTKGPVGLWPLAVMPLYLMIGPDRWRLQMWLVAVMPTLVLLLALVALMWAPASSAAIGRYLDAQLLATFSGLREAEFGRYHVLVKLLTNLSGPVLYSAVLILSVRAGWRWPDRKVWWLLAVALCVSLPLMVSPRQYSHYLAPSLPVYALAMAVYCQGAVSILMAKLAASRPARVVLGISPIVAGSALLVAAVLKFGSVSDDQKEISFVRSVSGELERGSELGTCPGFRNLRVRMYLFRSLNIRLVDDVERPWVLCHVPDPALGQLVVEGEVNLYQHGRSFQD